MAPEDGRRLLGVQQLLHGGLLLALCGGKYSGGPLGFQVCQPADGLQGAGVGVHQIDNQNKVVAYVRWNQGGQTDDVVVVANFSAVDFDRGDYVVRFPSAGMWYRRFNGDSKAYGSDFGDIGADQVEAAGEPPSAAVDMGKYSLQIFSKEAPAPAASPAPTAQPSQDVP